VLLAKTFRSSTFRRALVWIAIFGAIVVALLGYIYWSAAALVRGRGGDAIAAEHALLDEAALEQFVQQIDTALALSIALVFVLAAAASVTVTRRTVGRIEAINAISRAIMRSGLGERIPLRGTRDEWDDLAANLNSMLDRIEALMGEVRQFTDNVAHDLRTPLTRMRGRLERACDLGRVEAQDRPLIAETLADLDAVLGMFTSLSRISQIEASERTAAFGDVDLARIAHDVVELFEAAVEETGGQLEMVADRAVRITGDRDLLFDALANVVDNAIKHGRLGGRVRVTVGEADRGAFMAVSDDGPGIPVAERERVFKRFFRLERGRRTQGNGLGLSLVAAVARLHGAQITLTDTTPGLELRLWFPRRALRALDPRN
jgi:signal transduction histidine kinase